MRQDRDTHPGRDHVAHGIKAANLDPDANGLPGSFGGRRDLPHQRHVAFEREEVECQRQRH